MAEVALAFNALVERNAALLHELERVWHAVGQEGRTSDHASIGAATRM